MTLPGIESMNARGNQGGAGASDADGFRPAPGFQCCQPLARRRSLINDCQIL